MNEDDEVQVLSWNKLSEDPPQQAPALALIADVAYSSSVEEDAMKESGDGKLLLPLSHTAPASTAASLSDEPAPRVRGHVDPRSNSARMCAKHHALAQRLRRSQTS